MPNLFIRPRRLRVSEGVRALVRETHINPANLVYPIFVVPGRGVKVEIASMPGVFHVSPDIAVDVAHYAFELGISGVLIFGLPEYKDELGSSAWDPASPVQQAIGLIKAAVPGMVVISDVCLCGYTSHGHCGLVNNGKIENDSSLDILAKIALSHAEAGVDMVAPADMMDGRVYAIRQKLDAHEFCHVSIMSYAAKYASAYYGPFRDAADSSPQFGDRCSYQMDPANSREALREVALDVEEGADILIVKPGLAYLDIISRVKDSFNLPVAAYNVSGEYAMVKAASANGWVDEKLIVLETLTGFKRAGADIIITYHALDAARWLIK